MNQAIVLIVVVETIAAIEFGLVEQRPQRLATHVFGDVGTQEAADVVIFLDVFDRGTGVGSPGPVCAVTSV